MGRLRIHELALAAALAACGGLVGCAQDSVRIVGQCEPLGPPVPIATDAVGAPSIGAVDGYVLVSWSVPGPIDPELGYATYFIQLAQWFDRDWEPASEVIELGSHLDSPRTRWVAHEGALEGQVWADPELEDPTGFHDVYHNFVRWWRLSPPPGGAVERAPVSFDIVSDPRFASIGLSKSGYPVGAGMLPVATAAGGTYGALNGIPSECGEPFNSFDLRLLVIRPSRDAVPIQWLGALCPEEGSGRQWAHNPWLESTHDDGLFALFRIGRGSDGRTHYLELTDEAEPVGPPKRVGGELGSSDSPPFQPRTALVPQGRVLFTGNLAERETCHRLRVMRDDGGNAHNAPWQLPCMDDDRLTWEVELVEIPGGAVLVWSERSGPLSRLVEPDDDFSEAVHATILTSRGQRGSRVLEVTDDEATTLSPPDRRGKRGIGRFYPVAASDGDEVAVVWMDRRSGTASVYARRLRCEIDE